MMKLEEFRKLNLSVTWTLIDTGYKGSEVFRDELSSDEVIDYAISLLSNDNYLEEVAELAGESAENTEEINRYIKTLSTYEKYDKDKEFEKWVICYVNKSIQKKYDNCIDGLMELGDIWLKLGIPQDSPHIFQGANNSISPQEYYTMQNYENLYQAHINWVKNKLSKM